MVKATKKEAVKPPTFGEKAVGLTFNPGGHPEVNSIKLKCAVLIDELNDIRNAIPRVAGQPGSEKARLLSLAITELQTAQMWAVKGVTWTD